MPPTPPLPRAPLWPLLSAPEWVVEKAPVAYPDAMAQMQADVEALVTGEGREKIWLLEHPPLYTGGTSAKPHDLIAPYDLPVYPTGRGGQYTYHGPGQRVIYVMHDLARRDRDLRAHVARLEEWIIRALDDFGIHGERRKGRVGIWVVDRGEEKKIAAIGVRARRWVTSHGLALNVDPDLSAYTGIVPCGLPDYGVTSLAALGVQVAMGAVDDAFKRHYAQLF